MYFNDASVVELVSLSHELVRTNLISYTKDMICCYSMTEKNCFVSVFHKDARKIRFKSKTVPIFVPNKYVSD